MARYSICRVCNAESHVFMVKLNNDFLDQGYQFTLCKKCLIQLKDSINEVLEVENIAEK